MVTEVDHKSQQAITRILTSELNKRGISVSDIGFLGEENLIKSGKHTFIIDPLDGTTNYVSGIAHYWVSIAYAHKNILLSGVIYDPITDETYVA